MFNPQAYFKYSEELKRGPNTEIGPTDFFEMASTIFSIHPPKESYSIDKADLISDPHP